MREVKKRAEELNDAYTQDIYPKFTDCSKSLVDLFQTIAKEDEQIAFLLLPRFKAVSKKLRYLEKEMHAIFVESDVID